MGVAVKPAGHESTTGHKVEGVPLSHLSIELGHFYEEDLGNDFDFFRDHFRRIAGWATAARAAHAYAVPGGRPRISTCVLIDDYFGQPSPPPDLLPLLMEAARAGGLEIDYFVREAGCADPHALSSTRDAGVSLAHLVEARLVEDPPPGTTAARPPVSQTGWLSNGQRSPSTERREAMKRPTPWAPPTENNAPKHSIFIDVELWSGGGEKRLWSCPLLASVWQLLRLGMLRDNGRAVGAPQPMPEDLPDDWRRLPLVLRANPAAPPFNAYRTLTICAPLFLPVEHAVRTILERVAVDPAVLDQINDRARAEMLILPPAAVERIEYLFVDTGPVRGARPG